MFDRLEKITDDTWSCAIYSFFSKTEKRIKKTQSDTLRFFNGISWSKSNLWLDPFDEMKCQTLVVFLKALEF